MVLLAASPDAEVPLGSAVVDGEAPPDAVEPVDEDALADGDALELPPVQAVKLRGTKAARSPALTRLPKAWSTATPAVASGLPARTVAPILPRPPKLDNLEMSVNPPKSAVKALCGTCGQLWAVHRSRKA
jgi:hypothetical protein